MRQAPRGFTVALLVLAGLGLLVAIWTAPFWLLPRKGYASFKDKLDAQNACRTTLAQILGGAFFLVTGYLTWRNLVVSQEGQITARFNNAVAHLGEADNLPKRLGGIYALERIARESPKDHWPVMEILAAEARRVAPWPPTRERDGTLAPADIQALLTVLARREPGREDLGRSELLFLQGTDLQGLMLPWGGYLPAAILIRAHLDRSMLCAVHLEGASLLEASLTSTDLHGAHFQGAHLEGADLSGAGLQGAEFAGATYDADTNWPEGFDPTAYGMKLVERPGPPAPEPPAPVSG